MRRGNKCSPLEVDIEVKYTSHFDKKKRELNKTVGSDVRSLLLFHGTPQESIASILRDNFDLDKRLNGRKYFSEQPEVSVGYTNTGFNIAGKWVGKKAPPQHTAGKKSQANPAQNAANPPIINQIPQSSISTNPPPINQPPTTTTGATPPINPLD